MSRKTWLVVSATEWAASASNAAEPVSAPATPFAIAIAAFAARVASTVLRSLYTSLHDALGMLAVTEIGVFAQNTHWEREGAYTGEISPAMLHEIGVGGTLVGHSERRQYFGETDESTARRAQGAIGPGLDVIACVGETESEREADRKSTR